MLVEVDNDLYAMFPNTSIHLLHSGFDTTGYFFDMTANKEEIFFATGTEISKSNFSFEDILRGVVDSGSG